MNKDIYCPVPGINASAPHRRGRARRNYTTADGLTDSSLGSWPPSRPTASATTDDVVIFSTSIKRRCTA